MIAMLRSKTPAFVLQNIVLAFSLDILFGSQHDAVMKIFFLQLR